MNTEVDDGDVRVSVRVPASIIGKVDAAARRAGGSGATGSTGRRPAGAVPGHNLCAVFHGACDAATGNCAGAVSAGTRKSLQNCVSNARSV